MKARNSTSMKDYECKVRYIQEISELLDLTPHATLKFSVFLSSTHPEKFIDLPAKIWVSGTMWALCSLVGIREGLEYLQDMDEMERIAAMIHEGWEKEIEVDMEEVNEQGVYTE